MSATDSTDLTVFRHDYAPPAFWVPEVQLEFDLLPDATRVTSTMLVRRNDSVSGPLTLNGEALDLESVSIDGKTIDRNRYEVVLGRGEIQTLTIDAMPDQCEVSIVVTIAPQQNLSLSGLYRTSGNYCTQCEAQGFRRITFFPDRPDVMSTYRVTIRGDRDSCPIMLSNGNRIQETNLEDGRHQVVWEDPHPKPSYLFALVAGDLHCHRGDFVTRSGRKVDLEIWVEERNLGQCDHALVSLQKSMKWDEDVFGLEYDLDLYMIVAVDDFNMGAMENKGLNVFNSKYVLAAPETATDNDFLGVEAVIAHEYFHNWTGNRVTCRDWFQLTLKEGLTVFRDQQFTADQTSAAVKRIDDVVSLRTRQFSEDAGPMAHPIRPESYIAMDNFYTATVYDKGAEIIRMYHTRLGEEGFRRGMDLYFRRHDNSAVTCDDFRAAMADANDVNFDLTQRWYSQPGTPVLQVVENWDGQANQLTLTMTQSYPRLPDAIPGSTDRKAVPIPVRLGLLNSDGGAIDPAKLKVVASVESPGLVSSDVATDSSTLDLLLMLVQENQSWVISGLSERPVVSALRGFSAPVRLLMDRDDSELAFLMANDQDSFNRWDAGQALASRILVNTATQSATASNRTSEMFLAAVEKQLHDESIDPAYLSLLLELPTEAMIVQEIDACDPDSVHSARERLIRSVAITHQALIREIYDREISVLSNSASSIAETAGHRRLKNTALRLLAMAAEAESARSAIGIQLAVAQYGDATNMTDRIAALSVLADHDGADRDAAFEDFYQRYHHMPLVLDKWFALQSLAVSDSTFSRVTELLGHRDYVRSNPNRVRSVVMSFTMNHHEFHRGDGAGYQLLADEVLQIDPKNPQLASRLAARLNCYRGYEPGRSQAMRSQLQRIAAAEGLSPDTAEMVGRALAF